jgi:hypothetical protein
LRRAVQVTGPWLIPPPPATTVGATVRVTVPVTGSAFAAEVRAAVNARQAMTVELPPTLHLEENWLGRVNDEKFVTTRVPPLESMAKPAESREK